MLLTHLLSFTAVSLVSALSDSATHTACLYFMGPVWGSVHNYEIPLVSSVNFIRNACNYSMSIAQLFSLHYCRPSVIGQFVGGFRITPEFGPSRRTFLVTYKDHRAVVK